MIPQKNIMYTTEQLPKLDLQQDYKKLSQENNRRFDVSEERFWHRMQTLLQNQQLLRQAEQQLQQAKERRQEHVLQIEQQNQLLQEENKQRLQLSTEYFQLQNQIAALAQDEHEHLRLQQQEQFQQEKILQPMEVHSHQNNPIPVQNAQLLQLVQREDEHLVQQEDEHLEQQEDEQRQRENEQWLELRDHILMTSRKQG